MTTPDLDTLAALTRDYAAFQTRKSGLATALGGFIVLASFCMLIWPNVFGLEVLQRPTLEGFLLVPFIWLALKGALARWLYGRLGTVKATPDPAYQRKLWLWTLGLALLLLACLAAAIYGFISGFLMPAKPVAYRLSPDHPLNLPWSLLIWAPLLYLVPVPWAIRGVEEARGYLVLVAQCMLWLIPTFLFSFLSFPHQRALPRVAAILGPIGFLLLLGVILVWSALAVVRGWKEHLEYLALLRTLPRSKEG